MWNKIKSYIKYILSPEPSPEKWVFIVGCPNSGTTLLHNILAKHPQIGSMPKEGQFCTDQLLIPKSLGLYRMWATDIKRFYLDENSISNVNLKKLKKQWSSWFNNINRPILIERSPPNTARVKWLQKNFPNAYFIGIYRNGYVVAEGLRRKTGQPLEICAEQWRISNEIMLKDFPYLKNKIIVGYEELTENKEKIVGQLLQFLELPPLNNNVLQCKFLIHGIEREIKNLNPEYLASLKVEETLLINKVAGKLLKKLNYEV